MKEKIKLFTLKGQYERGCDVELGFTCGRAFSAGAELSVGLFHLDRKIFHTSVPAAERITLVLPDGAVPANAGGIGVDCMLIEDGEPVAFCSTAFDYADPERPVVRYGFLSDFGPSDSEKAEESLDFLAEFHMTHVQFYDWTYRHHQYEGPSPVYRDTMGKEIDFPLIGERIEGCKSRGMKPLGYGAVYAAGSEYLDMHPEQSLRDYCGSPYNLIDRFFIMDIRPGSGWRSQLMRQYRFAVEEAGFSGIHMDTYGYPKRAFASEGGKQELVYLEDDFPGLIDETRETLGEDAVLIFNNVGNWPVHATGPAAQDAVYIEVWEPHDSYAHIRQIILDALVYGKPVVLAAYLAPFRLEENHGGDRALNAALILHGAIASMGASHLLLGESGAALTQGYYNDYSQLRSDEIDRLRAYYDFQLRYNDIFLDPQLIDISETHTSGENREYFFGGAPVSADGRAGTVWTIVRESRRRKVFCLINLCAQYDSLWNRGKLNYSEIEHFTVQMPDDGEIETVYSASPDTEDGSARELQYGRTVNERGAAVQIEFGRLQLWTTAVVEYAD